MTKEKYAAEAAKMAEEAAKEEGEEGGAREGEPGGEVFHAWEMPEFERHEHDRTWYIGMGAVLLILVLWSIFTGNFLFAVVVVLFAAILVFHEFHEPKRVMFGITDRGLVMGGWLYPYGEVKRFWIVYDPPHLKKIYLDFKGSWRPRLSISLEDEDPMHVRAMLKKFIVEDLSEEVEPLWDRLGRWLKI